MSANAKISGSWKDVSDIQAKVSGAWKTVDEGYSKVSGVWKQFYSAVVPSASAYDLLETTILTSSASSVSFTGLESYTGYKHLQMRSVQTGIGFGSGAVELFAQFNADTSGSYAHHRLVGSGSSVSSNSASSVTAIFAGFVGADFPTATVMDILDPFITSKNTTVRCLSGGLTGPDEIHLNSGLYNNTSAITSVQLFPRSGGSFVTGSRFSLYGIKDS